MLKPLLALAFALFASFSSYAQTAANKTVLEGIQLPFNVQLASVDTAPSEIKPFMGVWSGNWLDNGKPGLLHVLVVERTEGDRVHGIYGYGDYPAWGVVSGAVRVVGHYNSSKGALSFKLPNGALVEYKPSTLNNTPALSAEFTLGRGVTRGVFAARSLQAPQ